MKNLFKYILTLLAGGDRNRGDFDRTGILRSVASGIYVGYCQCRNPSRAELKTRHQQQFQKKNGIS